VKVGDLVKYKPEYMFNSVGVILSVGYGEHYTDTEQSPALHPDVWVLTTYGQKERWNEMNLEVINEST
jgi:hypothetical protein